jgi:hypothetical protein
VRGSTPTLIGTTKLPDFVFTGGTESPTTIRPGGTTNISFDLLNRCPAPAPSRVGIFLADANLNLLAFIGAVGISSGAGTSSLPPTPITFSTSIAPGNYHIVLIADVDAVVAESNENNNVGVFALTIAASLVSAVRHIEELTQDVSLPDDDAIVTQTLEEEASISPVATLHTGTR